MGPGVRGGDREVLQRQRGALGCPGERCSQAQATAELSPGARMPTSRWIRGEGVLEAGGSRRRSRSWGRTPG
jgi:hypothetical protein